MQIRQLRVKNFRTLEDMTIEFHGPYTAVCGKNNSGKSNILRAIRIAFGENSREIWFDDIELSHKTDYPAWKKMTEAKEEILVGADICVTRAADQGLVDFIELISKGKISLPSGSDEYEITIERTIAENGPAKVRIRVADVEITDDLAIQEIDKKLGNGVIFHNSTMTRQVYFSRRQRLHGILSSVPAENKKRLGEIQTQLKKEVNRVFKSSATELEEMLGGLGEKLDVKLVTQDFDLAQYPFEISLGYRDFSIPLDDWGSGTRNQTLIVKNIFDAKTMSEFSAISERLTPILLIEEPESFLHPLAQAHFSKVLQELSTKLRIQVIVTTHSPYLLSHVSTNANVLLQRKRIGKSIQGSLIVPIDGKDWIKPFETTLGVVGPEFELFKSALFSSSDTLVLVEGESDKRYLELCRDPAHGGDALSQRGEIYAYGGYGTIAGGKHLLKFMRDRFSKVIVTFDLDCRDKVQSHLTSLGFEKDKNLFAIGLDKPGKRSIEGLLPDRIRNAVVAENAELIAALQSEDRDERTEAKSQLKAKYLAKFEAEAVVGKDDYLEFYKLCKKLNTAISH